MIINHQFSPDNIGFFTSTDGAVDGWNDLINEITFQLLQFGEVSPDTIEMLRLFIEADLA
jgi:hypothetical protein